MDAGVPGIGLYQLLLQLFIVPLQPHHYPEQLLAGLLLGARVVLAGAVRGGRGLGLAQDQGLEQLHI